MQKFRLVKMGCLLVIFCIAGATAAPSQEFQTVATFNGSNGAAPNGFVQGTDGNFYGTTQGGGNQLCNGGTLGCGTVFQLTPTGTLTTIYNFCSQANCADGSDPSGPLVQGPDGNFYGTTFGTGGASPNCQGNTSCGTIFQITPAGVLTTLYIFCSQTNCPDGANPASGLVLGSDGNFYGVTTGGGANTTCYDGCGTLFRFTYSGVLTTLYSFCSQRNCADGADPQGLVQGSDGNFYGTTYYGGGTPNSNCGGSSMGCGTAFQFTTAGVFTTLHNFCSASGCSDGANPSSGLTRGFDGNFYGTTYYGGNYNSEWCKKYGCGIVFQLTPLGSLATIYSFCSVYGPLKCLDGRLATSIVQGADGNLYGTTEAGGTVPGKDSKLGDCGIDYGCGTLYRLSLGGTLTTLYNFCSGNNTSGSTCPDGELPVSVMQAENGNFYGATGEGGIGCTNDPAPFGCGTVFEWSANVELDPTFTPALLTFPKTKVNATSKPKSITIKNVNIGVVATLDFSGFSMNGPFAISANTCGATLAAGKTCKVSITFTPTAPGVSTGTLSVSDNAPGSPQTVSLSGTGD